MEALGMEPYDQESLQNKEGCWTGSYIEKEIFSFPSWDLKALLKVIPSQVLIWILLHIIGLQRILQI